MKNKQQIQDPIDAYQEFINDSSENRVGTTSVLMEGYKDNFHFNSFMVRMKCKGIRAIGFIKKSLINLSQVAISSVAFVGLTEVLTYAINAFNI